MSKLFNLEQPLYNSDGKPIQINETTVAKYKDFAIKALITPYEGEASLPYESKFFRVVLSQKIQSAPRDGVELTFAEAMLITELVSRCFVDPIVTTRFFDVFDFLPEQPQVIIDEKPIKPDKK
jgi:hypothetical protein